MAKAATKKRAGKVAASKQTAKNKAKADKKATPQGPLYLTEDDVQRLVTV